MKPSLRLAVLGAFCLLAFAVRSPAPLTYQPGEGWTYNQPGSEETGKWQRLRAKDQMDVAQAAFENNDFDLALKAARRVVSQWPLSDYAPKAQYLVGRCYEAKKQDEKAFNAYQQIIERNPKVDNYDEILERQYAIAGRFLGGQRFKLWNYIPFLPSMEKTAAMYQKVVNNGPFSEVAPQAQMKIGEARENQSDLRLAVTAYETAADRYNDRPQISSDAMYKVGEAYQRQSQAADYDQNVAHQAIAAYTDFITLYPNDPRVPAAKTTIAALKTETARGSYAIAQFYETRKKWGGALVYYNEVLVQDPGSGYAETARQKINELKQKLGDSGQSAFAPVEDGQLATTPSAPEVNPDPVQTNSVK